MDAVSIFIDINKYGLNVKTAAHTLHPLHDHAIYLSSHHQCTI